MTWTWRGRGAIRGVSKWVAERVVRQDVRWVVFKGAGGHTHALPLVGVQILQDAPDISGCFGNPPGTPAGKRARARSPEFISWNFPMFEKLREASRNDAPANRGSDSPGCPRYFGMLRQSSGDPSWQKGTCKVARIHFLEFPHVREASRSFSK